MGEKKQKNIQHNNIWLHVASPQSAAFSIGRIGGVLVNSFYCMDLLGLTTFSTGFTDICSLIIPFWG